MSNQHGDGVPGNPASNRHKKRKWLRRIGFTLLLVAVALLGAVWVWNHRAAKLFNEEVERLRLAGEPVKPEDLISPAIPIPDSQNAAADLKAAAEVVDANGSG